MTTGKGRVANGEAAAIRVQQACKRLASAQLNLSKAYRSLGRFLNSTRTAIIHKTPSNITFQMVASQMNYVEDLRRVQDKMAALMEEEKIIICKMEQQLEEWGAK